MTGPNIPYGPTSWQIQEVGDESVINAAVGAGAEDNYVRGIVQLEQDAEACWLMEMKLPIAREKA